MVGADCGVSRLHDAYFFVEIGRVSGTEVLRSKDLEVVFVLMTNEGRFLGGCGRALLELCGLDL